MTNEALTSSFDEESEKYRAAFQQFSEEHDKETITLLAFDQLPIAFFMVDVAGRHLIMNQATRNSHPGLGVVEGKTDKQLGWRTLEQIAAIEITNQLIFATGVARKTVEQTIWNKVEREWDTTRSRVVGPSGETWISVFCFPGSKRYVE